MNIALWCLGILALAAILYILACMPRLKRPADQMQRLMAGRYAHRGLFGEGVPENSLAAFRRAASRRLGVELDVHLTKDRQVVVIHDSDLERLCGVKGRVEKMTVHQLKELQLEGTLEEIPTLEEVLPILEGRSPVIIDLKTCRSNDRELCRETCRLLEHYRGEFFLESFDPRALRWLKKHEPFWVRGQLAQNFVQKPGEVAGGFFARAALSLMLLNFYGKPDFVSFRAGDREKNLSLRLCGKLWKMPEVSWTARSQEELERLEKQGCAVIFEGFIPQ